MNIEDVVLKRGAHKERNAFCVMELVAYINGEAWTDQPTCSPTMVTQFLRSWNDLSTQFTRQRLKELVPHFVGCDPHPRWDDQRLHMFMDLCVRHHIGSWLRVLGYGVPMPEIVDQDTYDRAHTAVETVARHIQMPENMDRHYREIGRDVHDDSGGASLFQLTGYKVCWRMGDFNMLLLRLIRLATYEGHDPMPTCNHLITTNLEYVRRMLQLGR